MIQVQFKHQKKHVPRVELAKTRLVAVNPLTPFGPKSRLLLVGNSPSLVAPRRHCPEKKPTDRTPGIKRPIS